MQLKATFTKVTNSSIQVEISCLDPSPLKSANIFPYPTLVEIDNYNSLHGQCKSTLAVFSDGAEAERYAYRVIARVKELLLSYLASYVPEDFVVDM